MPISVEIELPPADGPKISRADLTFYGLDHSGPSYEARVFLGLAEATDGTPLDDPLYAGSFAVFGHGGCLGDKGHCDVVERRRYDPRPEHPLRKATKVVVANEKARGTIAGGGKVRVTVVPIIEPIPYDNVDKKHTEDPVDIGYVKIVTYR